MICLWKREWAQQKESILRQSYIEIACIMAMTVLFIVFRKNLNHFVQYTLELPQAVYAFWGIAGESANDQLRFYVQWLWMPLNVWIAWKACAGAVEGLWREEATGSIFTLCNQWYDRYQIGIAKYLWSVLKFVMNYTVLFVISLLVVVPGSAKYKWELEALLPMTGMYGKGMVIIILLISISTCYAMLQNRSSRSYFVDILVFGTLAVGNLYKIRDLLVLLLQRANRNYAVVLRMTGWLDGLKWLSPLSWLNPYTSFAMWETIVQLLLCVALSVGAACVGLLGYRVRRFQV